MHEPLFAACNFIGFSPELRHTCAIDCYSGHAVFRCDAFFLLVNLKTELDSMNGP